MCPFSFILVYISIYTLKYCVCSGIKEGHEHKVISLEPYKPLHISCCEDKPHPSGRELPVIYCYSALPAEVLNTFLSVTASLDLDPEQYRLHKGLDARDVRMQFENPSWYFNTFTLLKNSYVMLNPFNDSCFGIQTDKDYILRIQVERFDPYLIATFFIGLLLFTFSSYIAESLVFHYCAGTTIGVVASLVIFWYLFLKVVPLKRPVVLGAVAGVTTIGVYLLNTMFERITELLYIYRSYAIGYVAISGLVSFMVCYRFGPVTNPKSINLIKWALQGLGLGCVCLSSHQYNTTLVVGLLLNVLTYTPICAWILKFLLFCRRLFTNQIQDFLFNQGKRQDRSWLEPPKLSNTLGSVISPTNFQRRRSVRLRNRRSATPSPFGKN